MGERKRHLRRIWDGAIVCILTSPASAGQVDVDMEEVKLILSITKFTASALRNSGHIYITEKEEGRTWRAQWHFHGLRAVRKNRREHLLQQSQAWISWPTGMVCTK